MVFLRLKLQPSCFSRIYLFVGLVFLMVYLLPALLGICTWGVACWKGATVRRSLSNSIGKKRNRGYFKCRWNPLYQTQILTDLKISFLYQNAMTLLNWKMIFS